MFAVVYMAKSFGAVPYRGIIPAGFHRININAAQNFAVSVDSGSQLYYNILK